MHHAAWNPRFQPMQLERYVEKHIVRMGSHEFGVAGTFYMNARQEYLLKAAELSAMAQVGTDQADKLEFENLARSYLRLAKQAERDGTADLACKTPSKKNRDQA